MGEYMTRHSERLAKFEVAVYKQKEEMEEKMAEMMELLNKFTKQRFLKRCWCEKMLKFPTLVVLMPPPSPKRGKTTKDRSW